MFNLLWAPIAVAAGRELAKSGQPDARGVTDERRRGNRPDHRGNGRLRRRTTRPLHPLAEHREAI